MREGEILIENEIDKEREGESRGGTLGAGTKRPRNQMSMALKSKRLGLRSIRWRKPNDTRSRSFDGVLRFRLGRRLELSQGLLNRFETPPIVQVFVLSWFQERT